MCEIKIYNQDDELVSSIKTGSISEAIEKAQAYVDSARYCTAVITQDGVFYGVYDKNDLPKEESL